MKDQDDADPNRQVLHEGKAHWDVSDYGTLFVPPSDSASTILSAMTKEERTNFNTLLASLQTWHEGVSETPGLLFHPEARACLWAAALAKIADHFRLIRQDGRALFFIGAAWNISNYPVFAYNAALLSLNEGDAARAKNLLRSYLAEYQKVLKSATMILINPEITEQELNDLAESARARLIALEGV